MPIWKKPRLVHWLGRLALAVQDLCFGELPPTRRTAPPALPVQRGHRPGDPVHPAVLYEAPDLALLAGARSGTALPPASTRPVAKA